MLPAIGVIVGLYVITRMVEVLAARPKPPGAVALCAVVTLCGTIGALIVLLVFAAAGQDMGSLSPFTIPQPRR